MKILKKNRKILDQSRKISKKIKGNLSMNPRVSSQVPGTSGRIYNN